MTTPPLPIHDMASRHPGLTPSVAGAYLEAGRVCLDRHHVPPVEFQLHENAASMAATVHWQPADPRSWAAFANDIDATEFGGYLFALASVELTRGLVALSRAETRTGADYYMAPAGSQLEDLESAIRLEASGLDRGDLSRMRSRLKEKVEQANQGVSDFPALAVIVGFKAQLVLIEEVDST